jgi:hypothetical protein
MSFDRRIVIDTGVLVSAAIRPQSIPALALEKALLHFDVCASAETLAELETVLLRRKFDRYAAKALRQAFFDGFGERAVLFVVTREVVDCVSGRHSVVLVPAKKLRLRVLYNPD